MQRITFILILLIYLSSTSLTAGLLINEVATNTTSDWVELKYVDEGCKTIDISSLYVTMYYGANESIANESVTLKSCDSPHTPFDDRFAVIHLTDPITQDETDATGDSNGNGVLDLYCNNYSNSLWNSDCVVAIDTDDDPANGGIIDFISFSNRDGTPNKTIESYTNYAAAAGQWIQNENFQMSSFFIGKDGLASAQTIIRKNNVDTNSKDDFTITRFTTPGRENIINVENNDQSLFKMPERRIFYHYKKSLSLFFLKQCTVVIRIFTSTGLPLYTSQKYCDIYPGNRTIILPSDLPLKKTGLYIGIVEASESGNYSFQSQKFIIIFRK